MLPPPTVGGESERHCVGRSSVRPAVNTYSACRDISVLSGRGFQSNLSQIYWDIYDASGHCVRIEACWDDEVDGKTKSVYTRQPTEIMYYRSSSPPIDCNIFSIRSWGWIRVEEAATVLPRREARVFRSCRLIWIYLASLMICRVQRFPRRKPQTSQHHWL